MYSLRSEWLSCLIASFYILLVVTSFQCNSSTESNATVIEKSFFFEISSEPRWIPFFALSRDYLKKAEANKTTELRAVMKTINLRNMLVPQLSIGANAILFSDILNSRVLSLTPKSLPNGLGNLTKEREIQLEDKNYLMGLAQMNNGGSIFVEVYKAKKADYSNLSPWELAFANGVLPPNNFGRSEHQILAYNELGKLKYSLKKNGANGEEYFGVDEEFKSFHTDDSGNLYVTLEKQDWNKMLNDFHVAPEYQYIIRFNARGVLDFEWVPHNHFPFKSNKNQKVEIEKLIVSPSGEYILVVAHNIIFRSIGKKSNSAPQSRREIYIFNRRDMEAISSPIPMDDWEFWGIDYRNRIYLRMPIPEEVYTVHPELANGFRVVSKSIYGDKLKEYQVRVNEVGMHSVNFLFNPKDASTLSLSISNAHLIGMVYEFN